MGSTIVCDKLFLGVIVKVLSELELVGEEDIIIQVVKPSDET